MAPTSEACEFYRNTDGKFAAITYAAGPRGHTVSLHGVPASDYRARFLDVETARLVWGMLRLRLRLLGFERDKPEVRVA